MTLTDTFWLFCHITRVRFAKRNGTLYLLSQLLFFDSLQGIKCNLQRGWWGIISLFSLLLFDENRRAESLTALEREEEHQTKICAQYYCCTVLLAKQVYLDGKGIAGRGTKFNLAISQLNKISPYFTLKIGICLRLLKSLLKGFRYTVCWTVLRVVYIARKSRNNCQCDPESSVRFFL